MVSDIKLNKLLFLILMFSIFTFIVVVAVAIYITFKPIVKNTIIIEAGSEMVPVEEYFLRNNVTGTYASEISQLDLNSPGIYDIQIKIKKRLHNTTLTVVDTIAPMATAVNQITVIDETISPSSFVEHITDVTEVTVQYKEIPDFTKPGDQEVTIILEDTSKNQTVLTSKLTVLKQKEVVLEAGSNNLLSAKDFIEDQPYMVSFVTDITTLDFNKPGNYDILLLIDHKEFMAKLKVVDTTPPTATIRHQEVWKGEPIDASKFITDIIDATEVNIFYKNNPDFTIVGEQEVVIVLEDTSKNITELKANLTVKEDTQPPEIFGVTDKTIRIGDSISYRRGVTVKDNKDETVELQIDSSGINLLQAGTYQVIYKATDTSGNTATKISTITVKEKGAVIIDEETIYEMADAILSRITDENMTLKEKARKIYRWVRGHISYTGNSDKSDWLKEAHRGMKNGVGDCFTYYAVSQALLTRAGIENMRVTRVGGRTQHFWNLINCGDGWYHFDATPNKDKLDTFMLTDAQVAAYTKRRGNNYYTFDPALYPATPEQ